jgi:hypothetical protein
MLVGENTNKGTLPIHKRLIKYIVGELFADGADELGFNRLNILGRGKIGETGEGLCEVGLGVQHVFELNVDGDGQSVFGRGIGIDSRYAHIVLCNFALNAVIGFIVIQLCQGGLR